MARLEPVLKSLLGPYSRQHEPDPAAQDRPSLPIADIEANGQQVKPRPVNLLDYARPAHQAIAGGDRPKEIELLGDVDGAGGEGNVLGKRRHGAGGQGHWRDQALFGVDGVAILGRLDIVSYRPFVHNDSGGRELVAHL